MRTRKPQAPWDDADDRKVLELVKTYPAIGNDEVQRSIVCMIREVARMQGSNSVENSKTASTLDDGIHDRKALELVKTYPTIRNDEVQRSIVCMIREVARMQGSNSVEDSKNRKHLGRTVHTTARLWS